MGVATIGSALANRRGELNLEKGRAAEMIGMSRTTYSSYEQDAQRPSVDVFPALAHFLQVSIEEFLSLYGATCIAAARTSLARAGSGPRGQGGDEAPETSPLVSVDDPVGSQASSPESSSAKSATEATSPPERSQSLIAPEISLELDEVRQGSPESPESPELPAEKADQMRTNDHPFDPWLSPLTAKLPSSKGARKGSGHKNKKKKKGKKD
jgi:transcriptional regulator with XRE-family HTH domain